VGKLVFSLWSGEGGTEVQRLKGTEGEREKVRRRKEEGGGRNRKRRRPFDRLRAGEDEGNG